MPAPHRTGNKKTDFGTSLKCKRAADNYDLYEDGGRNVTRLDVSNLDEYIFDELFLDEELVVTEVYDEDNPLKLVATTPEKRNRVLLEFNNIAIPKRPFQTTLSDLLVLEEAHRRGLLEEVPTYLKIRVPQNSTQAAEDWAHPVPANRLFLPFAWEVQKDGVETLNRYAWQAWRRQLAVVEEQNQQHLTPFERNPSFWEQLWRVVERSDIVYQIVDGRDPMFFRAADLETYIQSIDPLKQVCLLVNKADLMPREKRNQWRAFFAEKGISVVFFSALRELVAHGVVEGDGTSPSADAADVLTCGGLRRLLAQDRARVLQHKEARRVLAEKYLDLEGWHVSEWARKATARRAEVTEVMNTWQPVIQNLETKLSECQKTDPTLNPISVGNIEDVPLEFEDEEEELQQAQAAMAEALDNVEERFKDLPRAYRDLRFDEEKVPALSNPYSFTVGFVGFPNVGKSSVINALLEGRSSKKVATSSTPGKTKYYQTLLCPLEIDEDPEGALHKEFGGPLILCDCPGLVFPSLVASKEDLVLNGVLPIERYSGTRLLPVQRILERIPSQVTTFYNVSAPPSCYRPGVLPVLDADLYMSHVATVRRLFKSGGKGEPWTDKAALMVLKDYVEGRLVFVADPPGSASNLFAAASLFGVPALPPISACEPKNDLIDDFDLRGAKESTTPSTKRASRMQNKKVAKSQGTRKVHS
ncbi:MAG: hypothetical protein KVP17_004964 [Porospora cf. gigantea B]|uniref:uncharacterized protein n=1 Tax=Porospora cf. gigantea B TaxID=2853592 RepID=UPI0035719F37|nr:MAG: hypothetical protein KVP17_004964 [Porospora cf. gigantea B]